MRSETLVSVHQFNYITYIVYVLSLSVLPFEPPILINSCQFSEFKISTTIRNSYLGEEIQQSISLVSI